MPNNASAWNYLRGILDHNKLPYASVQAFVEAYTRDTPPATGDIVDLENPPPSEEAQLPCPAAIELLADIHEPQDVEKAIEVRGSFLWLQSISEGSCHLALEITP